MKIAQHILYRIIYIQGKPQLYETSISYQHLDTSFWICILDLHSLHPETGERHMKPRCVSNVVLRF